MKHRARHIQELQEQAVERFIQLQQAFPASIDDDPVTVNGADIRMAVDDFKVILAEIRRLR